VVEVRVEVKGAVMAGVAAVGEVRVVSAFLVLVGAVAEAVLVEGEVQMVGVEKVMAVSGVHVVRVAAQAALQRLDLQWIQHKVHEHMSQHAVLPAFFPNISALTRRG
jgi:hypothetical protein